MRLLKNILIKVKTDDCSQFLKAYLQDAILIEKELNSNYEHYWDNFN